MLVRTWGKKLHPRVLKKSYPSFLLKLPKQMEIEENKKIEESASTSTQETLLLTKRSTDNYPQESPLPVSNLEEERDPIQLPKKTKISDIELA